MAEWRIIFRGYDKVQNNFRAVNVSLRGWKILKWTVEHQSKHGVGIKSKRETKAK